MVQKTFKKDTPFGNSMDIGRKWGGLLAGKIWNLLKNVLPQPIEVEQRLL